MIGRTSTWIAVGFSKNYRIASVTKLDATTLYLSYNRCKSFISPAMGLTELTR